MKKFFLSIILSLTIVIIPTNISAEETTDDICGFPFHNEETVMLIPNPTCEQKFHFWLFFTLGDPLMRDSFYILYDSYEGILDEKKSRDFLINAVQSSADVINVKKALSKKSTEQVANAVTSLVTSNMTRYVPADSLPLYATFAVKDVLNKVALAVASGDPISTALGTVPDAIGTMFTFYDAYKISGIVDDMNEITVAQEYLRLYYKYGGSTQKVTEHYPDTSSFANVIDAIAVKVTSSYEAGDYDYAKIEELINYYKDEFIPSVSKDSDNGWVKKTGQTKSYDEDGNVVTYGAIKDDGYYQKGLTRSYSRRDNIVIDNATNLEWQDSGLVYKSWISHDAYLASRWYDTSGDTAATYCSKLVLDGGGWRLPIINELEDLRNYQLDGDSNSYDRIFNYSNYSTHFWSSTDYANVDWPYSAWATGYGVLTQQTIISEKTRDYNSVRCVRGIQSNYSRLSRRGEIVNDGSTGLQWQDDNSVEAASEYTTWIEAIDYCENTLTLGGHDDWRLPNINELRSVVDYSRIRPALNTTVFLHYNDTFRSYWSSTSSSEVLSQAWLVDFTIGETFRKKKYRPYTPMSVRCVRDGEYSDAVPSVNSSIIMYLLN